MQYKEIKSDFTFFKYRRLCDSVKALGRPTLTFDQFCQRPKDTSPVVVLRHDVDRCFAKALDMARFEARRGLRATYFVRMIPALFQPHKIRELYRLGHEVGYHYEVLTKARGDRALALALFEKELASLRQVVPVHSASMHGSPLSPWNNLAIWQESEIGRFGLMLEASLTVDYTGVYYFTDTGRSWNADRFNIRDRVNSPQPLRPVHTTDELIDFLEAEPSLSMVINTHPNRWARTRLDHCAGYALDQAANLAKWIMSEICRLIQRRSITRR